MKQSANARIDQPVCFLMSIISLFSVPIARAQDNATGTINVRPNLGTQTRDQFIVCTGTSADRGRYGTKITGATGIVTFTGIPSGIGVVTTVNKAGFTGREGQWLVPPPGSNREVTIYMFTGSGGPTCPNTAATPVVSPSTVRITVTTPAGVAAEGFFVCVGTPQNRSQYGSALTSSTGVANFSKLPGTGMITTTVQKQGFASGYRDWYPTPGQAVNLTIPLSAGTGGYSCPGYVPPATPPSNEVKVEGTTLVTVPPGGPAVTLGPETLVSRGDFAGSTTSSTTDCTAASNRNVMIGVEGFIADTVIKSIRVSCTTVRDAITNERFIQRGTNKSLGEFYSRCSPGRVLVGFSGTMIFNQLRSFKVVCRPMGNDGRTTGTTTTLTEIGRPKSITFGPDNCTSGRSGRGLKISNGRLTDGLPAPDTPHPTAVVGLQLTCTQPQID